MPNNISSDIASVRLGLNAYLNDLKTSTKRKALPNFNEEILEGSFVDNSSQKVKDAVLLSAGTDADDKNLNFNLDLSKQPLQIAYADLFLYRRSGNFVKSHQESGSLLDIFV